MAKRFGRGVTLVELLVAVGLGVILIGVITFVWLQSNRIFTSTLHRLEAYGRLRTILDIMERDLANTVRTVDMEYYVEDPANANGYFDPADPGDTLQGPVNPGGGVVGGAPSFREPASGYDPLRSGTVPLPEFEEGDNANNSGFSTHPFFYAPLVFSPPPYQIQAESYIDTRRYWRDEVYVRTFAMAEEINRPALVHYRLVQNPDERSTLRRRMWYRNMDGELIRANHDEATDRVALLASGICDLKIGFFFKETASAQIGNANANGYWYHVGERNASPGYDQAQRDLIVADEQNGYISALTGAPYGPQFALSSQHVNQEQFGSQNFNACAFYYQGDAKIEFTEGRVLLRTIDDRTAANAGDTNCYNNFDFPGVRPGDKIFLYDARDDDDDDGGSPPTPWGGPEASGIGANGAPVSFFPNQLFTVDYIASDQTQTWISVGLKEPISFFRLSRFWLGSETNHSITGSTPGVQYGPDRLIQASFNVGYRVAFLPAAFRIHLSIDDTFNKKVLPIERVVHLIQR